MSRVLVVDDDPEIRETMSSLLQRQDITHDLAQNLSSTRELLKKNLYDLILLDVVLPDGNGLDLLPEINALDNPPEVIILTGKGDPEGAELAIERGAWDYLLKPSSLKEIKLSLNRALKYRQEKESQQPRALDLSGIVGSSPQMQACFDLIAKAAASDSNVLVTGETGVGKELIARTIHANSPRAKHPFVVVDCAGLTDTLVESTLFGHRKGAFTGAIADQPGLISQAHKGTLFLDEIGEMPLALQKSLLRVLQERKYRPVGANHEITSDFRLIAATNRDLSYMVEAGEFRSDLFYRIKTIELHLPPLRERPQDIKSLAMHFLDQLSAKYDLPAKGLGADFLEILQVYSWPGNVRELCNAIEQALVECVGETNLHAPHLPKEIRIQVTKARMGKNSAGSSQERGNSQGSDIKAQAACPLEPFKEYKQKCEKQYLKSLLDQNAGDVPTMLRISGLSRSHFYSLLKKYNLEP